MAHPLQPLITNHWRICLLAVMVMLGGNLLLGNGLDLWASMLVASALGVGYVTDRRAGAGRGVLLSLALCCAIAAWYYNQPGGVLVGLGYAREGYLVTAALTTLGLGLYGGAWGAALGLALALLGVPDRSPQNLFLHLVLLPVFALFGASFRRMLLELHQARQRFEQAALTDPLTGLGNRRALEQEFERYLALAERESLTLTVSLWDLDGLKRVNDRHGHAQGDLYLRDFGGALRQAMRRQDALFRVGGDEFVGLHLGLNGAGDLERRVREHFDGFSVGFAAQAATLDEALKHADGEMYRQKKFRRPSVLA